MSKTWLELTPKEVWDRCDEITLACSDLTLDQIRAIPQLIAWFRSCADSRPSELMEIFARKDES